MNSFEAALELDRAARALSIEEYIRPVVLEAGAGTGKTAALVARVLHWSLGPGWARAEQALGASAAAAVGARVFERVVAITFTERAALEMRERIASGLEQLLAGRDLPGLTRARLQSQLNPQAQHDLDQRLQALVGALQRLRFSTIHGFCAGLLRKHALQAGLHPAFRIDADGALLREALDQLLAEWLPRAFGAGAGRMARPECVQLAALGCGPRVLREALESLARDGAKPGALLIDPLPAEQLQVRLELLAAAIVELRSLFDAQQGKRISGAVGLLEQLDTWRLGTRPNPSLEELCSLSRQLVQAAGLKRLGEWAKGTFTQGETSAFAEKLGQAQELSQSLHAWLVLFAKLDPPLLRLSGPILAELLEALYARLRWQGALSFQDLLENAARLLRESTAVARTLREGIDQLLVDEFQDTDARQCELIACLALEGASRPGLFLVGDPKQSIYGWRSADLAAYDDFLALLQEAGASIGPLCANFRSHAEVLAEVERLLAPIMKARPGIQPAFQALLEARRPCPTPRWLENLQRVEHWVSWELQPHDPQAKTRASRAREIEAQAIAAELGHLHQRGLDWKQAAILMRTASGTLEVYLRALREHGIPYLVESDRSFYQTREILEAIALLSAVLDPSDALAQAAALRGPLVALPDALLLPLWQAGWLEAQAQLDGLQDTARIELLVDRLSSSQGAAAVSDGLVNQEHWPLLLKDFARALGELRRIHREADMDRFVSALRRRLPLENCEALRYLGAHRLANLELFYARLLQGLAQAKQGPHGLLAELRAGLAGDRELSAGLPADAELDAVRVLTIHAAKGLEFEQVYLVDLGHGDKAGSSRALLSRVVESKAGPQSLRLGQPSWGWPMVEERQRVIAAAEALRLLYVACTRAKERLVLCGPWPKDPDKPTSAPLMRLLQSRAQGSGIPALLRALEQQREPRFLDPQGVLWRVPGAPPTLGAAVSQPASAAAVLELGPCLAQALELELRLGRQRELAFQHAARTRSQPASKSELSVELERHAMREEQASAAGAGPPEQAGALARAAGLALHAVLADWSALGPWPAERRRVRARLEQLLRALLRGAAVEDALTLAEARLSAAPRLLARLTLLEPHVLAREFPLLLAATAEQCATGALIGALDLLYRDPLSGRLVIADFKSEAVAEGSPAALQEQAQAHAVQARNYAAAVERALGERASCEFWMLAADTSLTLEPTDQ